MMSLLQEKEVAGNDNAAYANRPFSEYSFICAGNETAEELVKIESTCNEELPGKRLFFDLGRLSSAEVGGFDKFLEQNKADRIIIELGRCVSGMDKAEASPLVKQLAVTVSKHFGSGEIILVKLSDPEFIRVGRHLRVNEGPLIKKEDAELRSSMEVYFTELTGCSVTDITKFYFYSKRTGYRLSDGHYEPECHEDIWRCVGLICSGRYRDDIRPDIRLTVSRFLRYKPGLQVKPYAFFLDKEWLPDYLMVSSTAKFTEKYREDFIQLEKLDWRSRKSALKRLDDLTLSDEFREIVKAFSHAADEEYDVPGVRYDLMLKNAAVPAPMLDMIRTLSEEKFKIMKVQINQYNAGVYYARLRGLPEEDFTGDDTVVRPTVVDIFGSCWCRTCFNIVNNDFAVNNYWFHVPPVQKRNPKVKYDPDLLAGKLQWTDRLVKKQFDHMIEKEIKESDGEWLILDLFSFIGPYEYLYENCIYGDFKGTVSRQLGAEKVLIYKLMTLDDQKSELWKAYNSFLDLIKKKYGDNIIIVNAERNCHWLGDNGVIYSTSVDYTQQNKYMLYMLKYTQRKLNCYSINIAEGFITDDKGIMARSPSHTSDRCYYQVHAWIRRIVNTRPVKKNYGNYNGELWLKNLLSLARRNPPELIRAAIKLSPVDERILNMGYSNMLKYWKILAKMYRFELRDMNRILNEFDFEGNDELKELFRSVMDKSIVPDPGKAKPDYPVYKINANN